MKKRRMPLLLILLLISSILFVFIFLNLFGMTGNVIGTNEDDKSLFETILEIFSKENTKSSSSEDEGETNTGGDFQISGEGEFGGMEGGGDAVGSLGFIGRGCNNYQYIDKDCDGFVIGGKGAQVNLIYNLVFSPLSELGADANDNDPTLNTPASVIARYGDFTNIDDFKTYLYDLGYTHTISNVYFVALNGDDLTGQPNNINRPYRHRPIPGCTPQCCNGSCVEPLIRPGDVVVYRGGTYPESLDTRASGYPRNDALQGTATQPILLINYPGERVIFTGGYSVFSFSADTKYTVVDGFEFDGRISDNTFVREVVSFIGTPLDHVTLKNTDIRNGERWGIFGYGLSGRDYVTLDNIVIHHIRTEHCLYRNDAFSASSLETDIGWVISNSLFYACDGHNIHWRGGTNFTFENNTLHSSRWNNIEIKNSATNGIIRNNLLFNAGRAPLVIYEDNDAQRELADGIKNILVTQNIFVARYGSNGIMPDTSASAAVQFAHNRDPARGHFVRPHRNVSFFNNIFYTTNEVVFNFDNASDVLETTIEKNIFYRFGANPPNDFAGMGVCDWTDGTHNGAASCYGKPFYIWNFASMQDPVRRPKIRNNIFANPLFMDVTNSYTTSFTPWFYNFLPTQNSPNLGFALPQYTTPADIRGVLRDGSPDAGAYEYDPLGSSSPYLLGVDPAYALVGAMGGWALTFRGYNFNSFAELEVCDPGNTCNLIPNSALYGITSNKIIYDFVTYGIPTGIHTFRVVNPGNVYSANRVGLGVQSIPIVPSNLRNSTVSPTSVSLLWDDSDNENGFYIERRDSSQTLFTRIWTNFVNDTDFTDTSVVENTRYFYRVQAFNYVSVSGYSNTLRVDVPPVQSCVEQSGNICSAGYSCPGTTLVHSGSGICCDVVCQQTSSSISAPANLYTYPLSANSINITWNDMSNNEEGFEIQFSLNQGGSWAQIPGANPGPNIQSTLHTGLVENTRYDYRIRAYNISTVSSYSNTDYSVTPPNTPTNLAVTRLSDTSARLSWIDNSNGELRFKVQRCTGATCTNFADLSGATNLPANTVSAPSTVTYTDTTLSSGTDYRYRVSAEQIWWSSLWSNTASTVGSSLCTNGQQRACPLTTGVCAGVNDACVNGQWSGCNYGSRYAISETGDTLCRDGYDNDCDSSSMTYITKDYDIASRNGQPPASHADDGCSVGITGLSAPSSVCAGSNLLLKCYSTVGNIQGVWGRLTGSSCSWLRWNGLEAEWNCTSVSGTSLNASCILSPQSTPIPGRENATQAVVVDNSPGCSLNPVLERIDPSRIMNNQVNTVVLSGNRFLNTCGVEVSGILAVAPFVTTCVNSTHINFTFPLGVNPGEYALNVIGDYSGQIRRSASINVTVTSQGAICGDGTCASTETCSTCSADCGTCPGPGGGGGGGGGSSGVTIESDLDIRNSQTFNLTKDDFLKIIFGGKTNQIKIGSISGNVLTLNFVGVNRNIIINLGQETEINLDNSSEMDAKIKLDNIFSTTKVRLTINKIIRNPGYKDNETDPDDDGQGPLPTGGESKQISNIIIGFLLTSIVALIAIIYLVYRLKYRRKKIKPDSLMRFNTELEMMKRSNDLH